MRHGRRDLQHCEIFHELPNRRERTAGDSRRALARGPPQAPVDLLNRGHVRLVLRLLDPVQRLDPNPTQPRQLRLAQPDE